MRCTLPPPPPPPISKEVPVGRYPVRGEPIQPTGCLKRACALRCVRLGLAVLYVLIPEHPRVCGQRPQEDDPRDRLGSLRPRAETIESPSAGPMGTGAYIPPRV